MRAMSRPSASFLLFAALILPASSGVLAQDASVASDSIVVNGQQLPDTSAMTTGPEVKGIITGRSGDRLKVTSDGGAPTVVFINDTTRIKAGGLFGGRSKLGPEALLNGLPVSMKTMQAGSVLLANEITLKRGDLKTANMIRHGTAQGFAEQTAATEALRGRMGDIDNYNVKGTTNVNFDTGKAALTAQAKADLCATALQAETTKNAFLLVVGYTDSTGSEELNQRLSEKRAASVINYLQQACHWKPYRMLTPTGMSEADPLASNETSEGKAQNRRVAVNVLVSKGLDGL
jgi:outer membrane protein OmpA-like peptidoglycan-associated protein